MVRNPAVWIYVRISFLPQPLSRVSSRRSRFPTVSENLARIDGVFRRENAAERRRDARVPKSKDRHVLSLIIHSTRNSFKSIYIYILKLRRGRQGPVRLFARARARPPRRRSRAGDDSLPSPRSRRRRRADQRLLERTKTRTTIKPRAPRSK